MKLLFDTNVFIPLEPTMMGDIEAQTESCAVLMKMASLAQAMVFLHPIQQSDIRRDKNSDRRTLRLRLFEKYASLSNPPKPSRELLQAIGTSTPGSNSDVDSYLIAALERHLVDVLVTGDLGMHRRCARVSPDLANRCLTVPQAIEKLRDELPAEVSPPPAVKKLLAYQLNESDPIFQSLRLDYDPQKFDSWLTKCCREHRTCWVVQLQGRETYSGICIINPEDRCIPDAPDPTLKICTFKIADDALGYKLGELLLRAVFDYAHANAFSTLFVETYPKQCHLIHLFATFGFFKTGLKSDGTGQFELRKLLRPHPSIVPMSAFEFHKWFGPHQMQLAGVTLYLVPIAPRFHSMLFPELDRQRRLTDGEDAFGNTIRKAYLCNSGIKRLNAGDLLLFYKSHSNKTVTALGVVEETLRTSDAIELERFSNRRTVFERRDIEGMTKRSTLGILFRYVPLLKKPIPIAEFIAAGIAKDHPQSITSLPQDANEWIRSYLK